ncbi:hypothetical protein C0995_007836 [Termitomyces sp. Mi166|nr:hypothetical protein C0995_007836 [Termitomyces sp. Mi166\
MNSQTFQNNIHDEQLMKAYKLFKKAEKAKNKTDREQLYQSHGLRFVENAFWSMQFSDLHAALSFNELHNNCHGLGGKHAFKEAMRIIKIMPAQASRTAAFTIGPQYVNFFHV